MGTFQHCMMSFREELKIQIRSFSQSSDSILPIKVSYFTGLIKKKHKNIYANLLTYSEAKICFGAGIFLLWKNPQLFS